MKIASAYMFTEWSNSRGRETRRLFLQVQNQRDKRKRRMNGKNKKKCKTGGRLKALHAVLI